MINFEACDWIVQKAYWLQFSMSYCVHFFCAICSRYNVETNQYLLLNLCISLSTVHTTYALCVNTKGFVHASRSTSIVSPWRVTWCELALNVHTKDSSFFHTKTLYYLKMIIVFTKNKVLFLQARIRGTVRDNVWVLSSCYISVKYRLGSELTVHLSSGCCVLNW